MGWKMITRANKQDKAVCCKSEPATTPEEIWNRPALSAIKYRVGTYSSFKTTMVNSIAKDPNLRSWTARSSDDHGIAFMDMWAYLCDILTFYQERIANEAYLRTAILPESVQKLASLLDYRPSPGAAASVDLAFTTEKDKQITITLRLKVQSVPGQNEKPQKFETIEPIIAYASLNEMRPKTTVPQILGEGSTVAVIKGINKGLKPGDYVLLVIEVEREEDPEHGSWELRMISSVQEDLERATTTISWKEGLVGPPGEPKLFAFRLRAYPFGHDAVDWRLIPPSLREPSRRGPLYPDNWNDKCLPEDESHGNQIFLDSAYSSIQPGSWIALTAPSIGQKLYRVLEVAETNRFGYMISSMVTRLTVDVYLIGSLFPLRSTTILAQSELMELAEVPISGTLGGNSLQLDGYFPQLQQGHRLMLMGHIASSPAELRAETVEIGQVNADQEVNETAVTLKDDLSDYGIDSVRIYGNIASATHGETVEEVLGDGDASATFQTFYLHKSPVTFIRQAGAPHGVTSTLEIRVGGILWHEVRDLYGCNGNDRVYITEIDEKDRTSINFGDGITGARLPSGKGNVSATFRQGLGRDGNVSKTSLTNLLKKPVGLKGVTNPESASGGVDPETREQIRENAPNIVRTFDRVVSLRDFEDAAREYEGIAKARARMVWNGEEQEVSLVVAADNDADIRPEDLEKIYKYLNTRRDTNRKLRIVPRIKVPIAIGVEVKVASDYLEKNVLDAASETLRSYFAFENIDIGQDIFLSDIYKALQGVEGLNAARISKLQRRSDLTSGNVRKRMLMHSEEMAAITEPGDISVVFWG
jgi:hypothetical protein